MRVRAALLQGGVMQKAPKAFTFSDLMRVLGRSWLAVLVLTLLGGGVGYYLAKRLPDNYSATAQLISDAGRSGLIADQDDGADETGDATATATIVETISTPVVLGHALQQMSPEVLGLLTAAAGDPENPPTDEEDAHQALLRAIWQNLQVSNSGRSFVINLRFDAENPVLAAGVANALANGYLQYRLEVRNEVYSKLLDNLQDQITAQTNELMSAEQTAQTMREQLRLLGQRSVAWNEDEQDEAIARNAELYARQREAEREVDASAVVYERLLLEHRQLQSRMGEPETTVQLFSPALVPKRPSGFNVKPILLALGLTAGFLVGLSFALLRARRRRPATEESAP